MNIGIFRRTGLRLAAAAVAIGLAGPASAVTQSFSYTGAIAFWTAPQDGEYRITATGAQGASGDSRFRGGRGARIAGTFFLTAGDIFQVLVGGMGLGQGSGSNGGGGGGTFFVSFDDRPLLVAGGGGGTRASVTQNGTDASVATAGYSASGSAAGYSPVLKTGRIGLGGIMSSYTWGSGGGGFYGGGQADGGYGRGGASWANGMTGGAATSGCGAAARGGFGGGGAGNGCYGGGGGGGYSGGDGGRVAGGGGSYNAGLDPLAFRGAGYGNGSLTISYELALSTVSDVPVPAALPLMLGGIAALLAARGRRRDDA
ncbi:VPLPA-CTERM sorting domain-containing protein [Rhodovulum sp. DZ06]|uniref:VPLPA-CTERM sorting domain-containing protein n=1 Tax=Rhodovulum sp. DZ06 TaxID=3425126 RepID=UPI003D34553D